MGNLSCFLWLRTIAQMRVNLPAQAHQSIVWPLCGDGRDGGKRRIA
jgi:hypothetical protein